MLDFESVVGSVGEGSVNSPLKLSTGGSGYRRGLTEVQLVRLKRGLNLLVRVVRTLRLELSPLRRMKVVGVSEAGEYVTVYVLPTSALRGKSLISTPKADATSAALATMVEKKRMMMMMRFVCCGLEKLFVVVIKNGYGLEKMGQREWTS